MKNAQIRKLTFLKMLLIPAVMLIPAARFTVAQAPASAPKASSSTPQNTENGKRLYLAKRCWECHDYEGQGGSGPRIAPPRLSLSAVTTYIRQPKGQMPPYIQRVLSDSEVADIYAFLQTAPKPPAAKSIPLLEY